MTYSENQSLRLEERVAFLEAEVARLYLFIYLFQETKKLKLDVSKFPVSPSFNGTP